MPDEKTTDAVIGIEAIKALFVVGTVSLCEKIEVLFNSDPAEMTRIAIAVGRAAREAMHDGG